MTKKFIFFITLIINFVSFSQNSQVIGIVLNEFSEPVSNVNISTKDTGVSSDENGFFKINIKSSQTVNLIFSHINYKKVEVDINLKEGEIFEFNPILSQKIEQISEIVVRSNNRNDLKGVINISPEKIRDVKGAQPGVENILKTLPGVSINNELSSQYSVRGGNFDENLIYVNGIEIYRPFLIRSGQQEGLSFINSEMTKNINFSAGGFEAKYGDKMSSVLDITYRSAKSNSVKVNTNLLGASITFDKISNNEKISNVFGARYRDNSLLINSKETSANYSPQFFDLQNFLLFKLNEKVTLSGISNISLNNYNFRPLNRQTNFGTIDEPIALVIFYEGQEKDKYSTYFNSISLNYKYNQSINFNLNTSFYNTSEQEYFDILAQYRLAEVNSNIGDSELGEVEFSQGVGSQLNHARNNLNANIFNVDANIEIVKNKNEFKFSLKYTNEKINDRIVEWEVIDSAGYFISPPFIENISEQPYEPDEGPIIPFQNIRTSSKTSIDRIQFYLQWEKESYLNDNKIYHNIGIRYHNWNINSTNHKYIFSPRVKIGFIPKNNKNMIYNIKYGIYYQPPFYKELRDSDGNLNFDLDAQKSVHYVFSNQYKFYMWGRPFRLNSELYYKKLNNLNSFTIENVRIRYSANNNTKGYAYGFDFRINGEFIEGTESWFSFGYLKTEENIENQGYIPRPTDQRLKFGILFQDYVPNIPELKLYINLIYNTGLPGGSPSYANPYEYLNRLPDYKRADLGISYEFGKKFKNYLNIDRLSLGVEIFNMFNIQNSITNTWVRDVYSKRQYSIPNYLTPRIFNMNLDIEF